ncbi:MAG: hypothetical protein CMI12_17270 [Oceanospirillum sp.]|nr:hypothetical protein [Oceanospirillum sp.]
MMAWIEYLQELLLKNIIFLHIGAIMLVAYLTKSRTVTVAIAISAALIEYWWFWGFSLNMVPYAALFFFVALAASYNFRKSG